MSSDVLLLAQHLLKTPRTFFIAKTDEKWFEVHQVAGDSFGCRIDSNTKLPVDESYCGILYRTKQDVLQIDNTSEDPRVAGKYVTADAVIGSYLGVRIQLSNGQTYGTICALDPEPAKFHPTDVEALKALARVLSRALDAELLAYKDSLSGLFNRTYYNALIAENRDTTVIVHLFDIDNFKLVNDQLGHAYGDQLIQFMGRVLTEAYPNADIIRLGGDEFCVISSLVSDEEDSVRLKKVEYLLRAYEYRAITASCGIAKGRFNELTSLLSQADKAMYQVKRQQQHLLTDTSS